MNPSCIYTCLVSVQRPFPPEYQTAPTSSTLTYTTTPTSPEICSTQPPQPSPVSMKKYQDPHPRKFQRLTLASAQLQSSPMTKTVNNRPRARQHPASNRAIPNGSFDNLTPSGAKASSMDATAAPGQLTWQAVAAPPDSTGETPSRAEMAPPGHVELAYYAEASSPGFTEISSHNETSSPGYTELSSSSH